MNDVASGTAIAGESNERKRKKRREPAQRTGVASSAVHIPRATYRLQFNAAFTFNDAIEIVPYLAALGVSDVYCSPYLRARPGSTHGYDIIDHGAINPEIGTRADLDRFAATLRAHAMRQIIDVVPNHMGVLGGDNAWWLDVLENGPASRYAAFFDIDWQPASPALANRVLVPVLGDHYGIVLERGELALTFNAERGAFELRYYDHHFPVDPREYPRILDAAMRIEGRSPLRRRAHGDLERLSAAFGSLPDRSERSPERLAERRTLSDALKGRLASLVNAHAAIGSAIERAVSELNGLAGVPQSFDALDRLIDAQAYRLAYWRVASDEINYRRFFNINELAALRMENDAAFEATHGLVFELLAKGIVHGLRVDHPDGLFDPAAYFERLQKRYAELTGRKDSGSESRPGRPLYLVIEKIFAPFEHTAETLGIYGTTGYRFANVVNALFVDTEAERRFTRIYTSFIGDRTCFEQIAHRSKRVILRSELAAELTVLANQLAHIARADRRTRDHTLDTLRQALADVIVFFPVYRTYITSQVSAVDRRYIEWAVSRAKRHSRAADATIFDFVRSTLLCELSSNGVPELAELVRAFVMRFQQLTAPVMAKGVEDTSFYIYNRLVSLNDVGGDPGTFGMPVRAFHGASADRARKWPHTMLATSTHDNKRSEDVRARIDVLSEMPGAWRLWLRRWSRMNRGRKQTVQGNLAPSRNDEYLLYQTLVGSLPLGELDARALAAYRDRIEAYMLKAVHEAKIHTSWVNIDEAYDAAVTSFVHSLLASERSPFLESLRTAVAPIAWVGLLNSLSMVLIKLTSPGVPDIYQGNELWDFSLVDPDNRRPVDYTVRARMLEQLLGELSAPATEIPRRVRALFDTWEDGRPKLFLTQRALALRRTRPDLFLEGGYTALDAEGMRANHVVAFARRHEGAGVVTLAGRLYTSLLASAGELPCGAAVWEDTAVELPFLSEGTRMLDALTGRTLEVTEGGVRVADAFAYFPGAILLYDAGESPPL